MRLLKVNFAFSIGINHESQIENEYSERLEGSDQGGPPPPPHMCHYVLY